MYERPLPRTLPAKAEAPSRRRRGAAWRVGVALALSSGCFAVLGASPASAYIYFLTYSGHLSEQVGRANLDGSSVNQHLVDLPNRASAVAADGSHVYWASSSAIGRADPDGSHANLNLVPTQARSIAVDSSHIYTADTAHGLIGRANLDGSGFQPNLISDPTWSDGSKDPPTYLALGNGGLYWYAGNRIGRANLDGTGVNDAYISNTGGLPTYGLAFDGAFFYWSLAAQGTAGSIARVNADGSAMNKQFIPGLDGPNAVGVYAGHVYWTEFGGIWRANLDGSHATQFIGGLYAPHALAFDALGTVSQTTKGSKVACVVPKLRGATLVAAKRSLTRAHCRLGTVKKRTAHTVRRGRVVASAPPAGRRLAAQSKVSLVISR